MKSVFTLLIFSLGLAATAQAEDARVLSCTVDFKVKDKMTTVRTQANSWLLPVDKGSVKLDSLGNVRISLAKKLVEGKPQFRLSVTDGKNLRNELNVGYNGFELALPVSVHIDDGEDGADYDQVKVSCDSSYAAG